MPTARERWTWREPAVRGVAGSRLEAISEVGAGTSACSSCSYSVAPGATCSDYSTNSSYTHGGSTSCSSSLADGSSRRARRERPRRKRPRDFEVCDVEFQQVPQEDCPFLLGKGGLTLQRIGTVAGCEMEIPDMPDSKNAAYNIIQIRGTADQRERAKRYIHGMVAHRRGRSSAEEELAAGHCTTVPIPSDAVGLVVGKGGRFLRSLEEQFGVLMHLANSGLPCDDQRSVHLIILGDRRNRRGAQLSVMSTIEVKFPGRFTAATHESGRTYDEEDEDGDWGTSTAQLSADDIAFAIGKKGTTRRKLEKVSNCIVSIVHDTLFVSGLRDDRARARDYLRWLFEQLDGPMRVNIKGRKDVTTLDVPQDAVGYVTGNRRETITRLEDEFGVLTFFNEIHRSEASVTQRLLIFGPARGRLGLMLEVIRLVENMCQGYFSRGVPDKTSDRVKLDTERMKVGEEAVPRLMGQHSELLKRMRTASGAMMQYTGGVCWVAGTLEERRRCLDYVTWVCEHAVGKVTIDTRGRSDVTEVYLPARVAEQVAGSYCEELRKVERESQCVLVLAYDHLGGRRLCIFSRVVGDRFKDTGRTKAERMVNQLIHSRLREFSQRQQEGDGAAGDENEEDDDGGVPGGFAIFSDASSESESAVSEWNHVDWDS